MNFLVGWLRTQTVRCAVDYGVELVPAGKVMVDITCARRLLKLKCLVAGSVRWEIDDVASDRVSTRLSGSGKASVVAAGIRCFCQVLLNLRHPVNDYYILFNDG